MVYYNEHINNFSDKPKKTKNYSDKPYYVKKITQILLSLSLFSLVFSQSSLILQSYEYIYEYIVSNLNLELKLFTYTTERNCIFLLCNGILVLIIQSSGLISKITPAETGVKGKADENVLEERKAENVLEEKIREGDREEEDCDSGFRVVKQEEEEEEEEEEDEGEIDSDELHKKCEDFIKKMKQEILSS